MVGLAYFPILHTAAKTVKLLLEYGFNWKFYYNWQMISPKPLNKKNIFCLWVVEVHTFHKFCFFDTSLHLVLILVLFTCQTAYAWKHVHLLWENIYNSNPISLFYFSWNVIPRRYQSPKYWYYQYIVLFEVLYQSCRYKQMDPLHIRSHPGYISCF